MNSFSCNGSALYVEFTPATVKIEKYSISSPKVNSPSNTLVSIQNNFYEIVMKISISMSKLHTNMSKVTILVSSDHTQNR